MCGRLRSQTARALFALVPESGFRQIDETVNSLPDRLDTKSLTDRQQLDLTRVASCACRRQPCARECPELLAAMDPAGAIVIEESFIAVLPGARSKNTDSGTTRHHLTYNGRARCIHAA